MGALSRLQVIAHPTETMPADQSEPERRLPAAPVPGDFFNILGRYRNPWQSRLADS
jgi:hypothetical protein